MNDKDIIGQQTQSRSDTRETKDRKTPMRLLPSYVFDQVARYAGPVWGHHWLVFLISVSVEWSAVSF